MATQGRAEDGIAALERTARGGDRQIGSLASHGDEPPPVSRWSRVGLFAALAILVGLMVARGLDVEPLTRLRLLGFDLMQRMTPAPRSPDEARVVVLDIDDRSLASIGQWPWPREVLGEVVAALNRHGVSLIAFDILFAEPDRMNPGALLDRFLPDAPVPADLTTRMIGPDAAFIEAIERSAAPVVLGMVLGPASDQTTVPDQPILAPGISVDGPSPLAWLPTSNAVIGNIGGLDAVADGRGFLTIVSDGDGVVRRLPLLARVGPVLQTGLVLEIARIALGGEEATIRTHSLFGLSGLTIGALTVSTDRGGAIWLRGRPEHDRQPGDRLAVVDLLNGTVATEALAGSIVLIGSTALGLGDLVATASGDVRAGVDVMADGIRSVLAGDQLVRPGHARWLEMLIALVIGLIFIYRMSLYDALRTAIWGGIIVAVIAAVSLVALAVTSVLIDPTFPILVTVLLAGIAGYVRSRQVERGRALAKHSLAESDAFIHRLVAASFDAVVAVDPDGRLLFANRAARSLPIFDTEPVPGTDVMALLRRADHGADGDGGRQLAEIAAHPGTVDLEGRDRAHGGPVLLEAAATALDDEQGAAIVLVMRDVTERRAAERRIEAQAEELRRMTGDLRRQTDDAERARAAAESASAAKTEFLMLMSHELRTPLNAVIGFADLMGREPYGPIGDDRYRVYLNDIRDSGGHLLDMIDSILEVIRLDERDQVGGDDLFPVAAIVDDCCAAIAGEAKLKSVEVQVDGTGDAPRFRGEARLMRHVVNNLLSNAVKFSDDGGLVSVSLDAGRDRGLTIRVTDSGRGMSQAELDNAISLLEPSGKALTRGHGGIGVGLALTKMATEKHGGRLKLVSAPGRGTTAEVWFPDARLSWPDRGDGAGAGSSDDGGGLTGADRRGYI